MSAPLASLLQERRDDILAIMARYGARNVRVFGSFVRGEQTDDSDIDFLLELPQAWTLSDRSRLQEDLEALLQRPVDIALEGALQELIQPRVMREAVLLEHYVPLVAPEKGRMKDQRVYLREIVYRAQRIMTLAQNAPQSLNPVTLEFDALIRNFQVMGDAVKRMDSAFREQHNHIPWRQLTGLRDVVVHHYDAIDPTIIAGVIAELPALLPLLQTLLAQSEADAQKDDSTP